MLINDSKILKNSDKIFKSQIVDSYIQTNNIYNPTLTIGLSGMSIYNPLNIYWKTPNETFKFTRTTDSAGYSQSLGATNESSYKNIYFGAYVDGVYRIEFNGNYQYRYRGDLFQSMNQFLKLSTYKINIPSVFNQSFTNQSVPRTLKNLQLEDATIYGDIATVKNFENIEILRLVTGNLSGVISDINFKNLINFYIDRLFTLQGDVKELVNNNPTLTNFSISQCYQMGGDITDMDISNITSLYWYCGTNYNLTGNFSNWTFNNSMTNFQIYFRGFGGDITNWDISNTQISSFYFSNYGGAPTIVSGDTSAWVLPATLSAFQFYALYDITSIPNDFSTGNPSNITIQQCSKVANDFNSINWGNNLHYLYIDTSLMTGNLELYSIPTGLTSLRLSRSKFTGNLSGMSFHSGLTEIALNSNLIAGSPYDVPFSNLCTRLELGGNSGITFNLNDGEFHTKYLNYLYLDNITSGISGDFSNFIIDNTLYQINLYNTPINSDISKLNISKVQRFSAYSCGITADTTNWITGTTSLTYLQIQNNLHLSGDTGTWDIDNISSLYLQNTALSGALKHNNVYVLYINDTNISSNIETDFVFTNPYYFNAYYSNIYGHLSGVTLGYNSYYFQIYGNPAISGTNEFINYLFDNRVLWTRVGSNLNFQSIADTATGVSETTGDTGSWSDSIWNLTEAYVNNLADGLDWNGSGSNTPWNSKQKMWWQKNAHISSTNTTKRYKMVNINYS